RNRLARSYAVCRRHRLGGVKVKPLVVSPLVGEMAGRPEGVERKTLHAAEIEFAARIPCGNPKMRSYDCVM
ncbi:hypothetical protein, partial [Sinorhizobium meliloti]